MQKNIRIIPKRVLDRIHTFELDDIVVACVKKIEPQDVDRYAHLGLKLAAGQLVLPGNQIPPPAAGRFSRANVEGREVVSVAAKKRKRGILQSTGTLAAKVRFHGDTRKTARV